MVLTLGCPDVQSERGTRQRRSSSSGKSGAMSVLPADAPRKARLMSWLSRCGSDLESSTVHASDFDAAFMNLSYVPAYGPATSAALPGARALGSRHTRPSFVAQCASIPKNESHAIRRCRQLRSGADNPRPGLIAVPMTMALTTATTR